MALSLLMPSIEYLNHSACASSDFQKEKKFVESECMSVIANSRRRHSESWKYILGFLKYRITLEIA